MERVAIIGCGDLGKQFAHYMASDSNIDVVGFFDDYTPKGEEVNGTRILGDLKEIESLYTSKVFDSLICGIGYKYLKEKFSICEQLELKGIPFYTYIHPSSIIDSSSVISVGSFIYPGVIVDQNVVIGKHSILNLGSIISHDSKIGNSCFLSPNVSVAGFCEIKDYCILGISSIIIDNIEICESVQLGAGSLVIKNINEPGLYVGSPSRKIK